MGVHFDFKTILKLDLDFIPFLKACGFRTCWRLRNVDLFSKIPNRNLNVIANFQGTK